MRNQLIQFRPRTGALCALLTGLVSAAGARGDTPATANWTSAVNGDWTTAADWSTNPVYPNNSGTATYNAAISTSTASYSVTISTPITVNALTFSSTTAGLYLYNRLQVTNALDVESGYFGDFAAPTGSNPVIAAQTLIQGPTATFNLTGMTLSGVSLGSDINLPSQTSGSITVAHGLNLNGHNFNMTVGPSLYTADSTGLTGTGTITINALANSGNVSTTIGGASTLTVGPGVTIQTGAATGANAEDNLYIGSAQNVFGGTINSQSPDITVYISGAWTNTGTLEASNGASLVLGGSFTTAGIGKLVNAGGNITVVGAWNNSGANYVVSQKVGPLNFTSGNPTGSPSVTGGTLSSADGTPINLASGSALSFTAVTVTAPLNIGQDSTLSMGGVSSIQNTVTFAGGSGNNLNGSTLSLFACGISGTGTFVFNSTSSVASRISNTSGTSTIGPGITLMAGTSGAAITAPAGSLTFNGTVVTGPGAQAITFGTGINFGASVTVLPGGTFTAPSVTNFSNGVLSSATYVVDAGSTLRLPGGVVTTDAAQITLNGPLSTIYSSATANTNALASLSAISPLGSLTITGGQTLVLSGSVNDQGSLVVGPRSRFGLLGTLSVTNGGRLGGQGTFTGNVANAAVIHPGSVTGLLTIAGPLTQTSTGDLDFTLNSPTDYSQLSVTGLASLGGVLTVSAGTAFAPSAGDTYQLFNFSGGEVGLFSSLTLPPLPSPLAWQTSQLYTAGSITAVAVPDPSGRVSAISGLAAVLFFIRGRCNRCFE